MDRYWKKCSSEYTQRKVIKYKYIIIIICPSRNMFPFFLPIGKSNVTSKKKEEPSLLKLKASLKLQLNIFHYLFEMIINI